MSDSEHEENVAAGPGPAAAAAGAGEAPQVNAPAGRAEERYFKLPEFWPSSIPTWFGVAEAQFELRGVTSQRARLGLVASILPEISAKKVTHLLQSPTATCYDDLKKALLYSHLLSEGIQHHPTTAFHPQSNGMVERAHRRLKEGLKARPTAGDWLSHLPWVLLGMRSTPRSDSGISPAELTFGSPPVLPSQLPPATDAAPSAVETAFPVSQRTEPLRRLTYAEAAGAIPGQLSTATYVYVRRGGSSPPLLPPYSAPYLVLNRSAKFFPLDVGGRHDRVTVDRLKPHLGDSPLQPAAPPRSGRPPLGRVFSVQAILCA